MKPRFDEIFKEITGDPDQTITTIPTLANGVTCTVGASWVLGAFATILAAGSNTTRNKIIGICPSGPSAADEYQINIYAGSTLMAAVPYTQETATGAALPIMLPKPFIIDSATDIKAKVASLGAAGETINVKLIAVPVNY